MTFMQVLLCKVLNVLKNQSLINLTEINKLAVLVEALLSFEIYVMYKIHSSTPCKISIACICLIQG